MAELGFNPEFIQFHHLTALKFVTSVSYKPGPGRQWGGGNFKSKRHRIGKILLEENSKISSMFMA